MSDVKIENNTAEVLNELDRRTPVIMEAVGLQMEGNSISEITKMGAVDTGRLRNSITYATSEAQGQANTQPAEKEGGKAKAEDYEMRGKPEASSVYIGTNVEYAPAIEYGAKGRKGRPFLRNAVANYQDDYKDIIYKGLK